MMIYDCRQRPDPGTARFRCPVRVVDANTGEKLPNVFYLDTRTGRVGRFVTDQNGRPLVGPDRRSRLEVWTVLSWVAVTIDGKEVVAKYEGNSEEGTA